MENLVFINRKRGRVLLYDGYQYYKQKKYGNNNERWICSEKKKKKCVGSLTIDDTNSVVKNVEHGTNCVKNIAQNEVTLALEKAKEEVRSSDDRITVIYKKAVAPLRNKGLDLVSKIPNFESTKHALYSSRNTAFQVKKSVYTDLADVEIPAQFHKYLLADYIGFQRILIFSTNKSKELLKENKEFFMDGTFKSVPRPFYQLVTIHGDVGSTSESTKTEPLVYALLPSKKEDTYFILFDLIKAAIPEWNPTMVHVDFEAAITNGLKKIFPDIIIKRCYYHYTQSLWRKSKEIGMKLRVFKRIVQLCCVLPLLPEHLVEEGWHYIKAECVESTKLQQFMTYFCKNYMKAEYIKQWCIYNQRHRTNNICESWNGGLNKNLNKNYVTMARLLTEIFINPNAKLTSKRSNKYRLRDHTITNAQMQLSNHEISVGHFLEKLR